jgi:hypothetical protein
MQIVGVGSAVIAECEAAIFFDISDCPDCLNTVPELNCLTPFTATPHALETIKVNTSDIAE